MSMNYYAIDEYGLYLTDSDLAEWCDYNNIEPYEAAERIGLYHYSDVTGEMVSICDRRYSELDNQFYLAPLKKYPSLFERAYSGPDEAIKELREIYGGYLPMDFDYEARFVHIYAVECS